MRLRRIMLAVGLFVLASMAVTAAALWHAGYRVYVLHTGSMTPTYRPGDIVVDKPAAGPYHVGQVITFRTSIGPEGIVTHRISRLLPSGDINTKGDANPTPDVWNIPPRHVEGTVMFGVRDLGFVLVFFRQPAGIGAIATAVFGVALLWGLFFPSAPENADPADEGSDAAPKRRALHRRRGGTSPVPLANSGRSDLDILDELVRA